MECMSPTTCPRPADRPGDGASHRPRPRRRPVPRRRLRPRRAGAPRAGSLPPSDAEPSIPDSALGALSQQGYTIGEVMGRSTAPSAPRRGLNAQGRHVVIRVVDLPCGRAGSSVLRRLADLRVLRHPGLVTVREVVSLPDNRAGVIMDLVEGAGLDVVLGARGRLNVSWLATLLDVLGSALAYLHEHGATHGDVSAGNVLVAADGHPVLVDLLGSAMETGTQEYAAPERLAGAPASSAGDVYALARLLTECAGQGGTASRRLAGILTDALAEDPADRPSARDLAARAPQLGQASPIELPDGARLAAGSLRAAARTPTRTVGSRLSLRAGAGSRLRTKGEPRKEVGSANSTGRGPAAIRWGRRAGAGRRRTRVWGLAAVVLVAISLAAWGPSASAGALPVGSPSPATTGSSTVRASTPTPGGDGAADMVSVVVGLADARDRALMAGDAIALAATTVPGSPAAQADTQVLTELLDSGEGVKELHTSVSQVAEMRLPDDAAEQWTDARAVQVTLSQSASTRSGPAGTRTVPALQSRRVVLIVVPEPWRVADIRTVE